MRAIAPLVALARDLLDLVAPPRCAACDEPFPRAPPLCDLCREGLVPAEQSPEGVAAAFLHGGPIAAAIHRAKYGRAPRVAAALGALLVDALPAAALRAEVVAPIPLHPRRLASRGFNQAAELAAAVARATGATLARGLLARTRDTPSQTTLDRAHRGANVLDAFAVARADLAVGRAVLIVDDVTTTGSTMAAAFAALRGAGAREARGAVLAAAALRAAQLSRATGSRGGGGGGGE